MIDDFQDAAGPIDITPEEGATIMFDAINLNDRETFWRLIEAGVPVDVRNEFGDTPLILAVHRGHFDLANELLALHADPNAKNHDGLTPIYYAARANTLMMKLLLDAGATAPTVKIPELGQRLVEGVMAGYDSVVAAALAAGANANTQIPKSDGATALHIAGQNGKLRMVAALVEAGANINSVDNNKRSVLRAAMEGGDLACVRTLLDAGADTHNKSLDRSSGGDITDRSFGTNCNFEIATAVVAAAKKFEMIDYAKEGKAEAVRSLLADGAPADTFDRFGGTALFWACENNHPEVVRALIAGGADVHLRSKNGDPIMIVAVVNNAADCIAILAEAGASVLDKDLTGTSPAGFVSMSFDATGVTPETRRLVEHFKVAEVERVAQSAICLNGAVAPMKTLRFQPRPERA